MKIALGSDHAGFFLKIILKKHLETKGFIVSDLGCYSEDPVDYPDYASSVARAVADKTCEKGIILCGSGVGASIAANKIKGARASVCHDTYSSHQGVEHDDMNILTLGARIVGSALAIEIVDSFVKAQFSKEERHVRRLQKILDLENL